MTDPTQILCPQAYVLSPYNLLEKQRINFTLRWHRRKEAGVTEGYGKMPAHQDMLLYCRLTDVSIGKLCQLINIKQAS